MKDLGKTELVVTVSELMKLEKVTAWGLSQRLHLVLVNYCTQRRKHLWQSMYHCFLSRYSVLSILLRVRFSQTIDIFKENFRFLALKINLTFGPLGTNINVSKRTIICLEQDQQIAIRIRTKPIQAHIGWIDIAICNLEGRGRAFELLLGSVLLLGYSQ